MLTIKTNDINMETTKKIISTDDILITLQQDTTTNYSVNVITKIPLKNLVITYEDDTTKDIDAGVIAHTNNNEYEGYYDEFGKVVFEIDELTEETLIIEYYVLDSENVKVIANLDRAGVKYVKNNDTILNIYESYYCGNNLATNYMVSQYFDDLIPTKIKIKNTVPYNLTLITENHIHQIENINDEEYLVDIENYDTITAVYIYEEEKELYKVRDQILVEGIINTESTYHILQNSCIMADNSINALGYKEMYITDEIQLDLNYEIIDEKKEYYINDEFEIKFTRNTEYYVIDKPVITILIPEELEYVNSHLEYTSIIDEITYISTNKDYPMEIVEPEIIPSYKETTQTAIRFTFTEQFQNFDGLTVALTLKIKKDTNQLISFNAYIGNYQSTFYTDKTGATAYTDILDLDNDNNISERIVITDDVILKIGKNDFELKFQSCGNQDTEYKTESITSSGGNINYLLTITNNNDLPLNNIEIINILPNINDTYNTNKNLRNSEYEVYLLDEITSTITSNNITNNTDLDIYYSDIDPIRFDEENNEIGLDSWSKYKEYTDIKSIKIKKDVLEANEQLQIIIPAMTSLDSTTTANNTVAIKAELNENIVIKETNITSTTINNENLNISGYIWLDNGDGIYEFETKLNNIEVYLLDEFENILNKVITSPYKNENGYYNFNNLETNNYYIKINTNNYTFTKEIDSKINIDTKLSELINLTENKTVPIGLIEINYPVINIENKKVYEKENFDPLDGITAYDQFNNDITSKINVIENNVNTNIKGTYTVKYEVIDDYNLQTTKTIYITVTNLDITQAKTDLIQSIALQQTGLAHIINAEGEKIQKILKKNNIEEIIKTNKSVNNMINSITKLEVILQSKITTIKNK